MVCDSCDVLAILENALCLTRDASAGKPLLSHQRLARLLGAFLPIEGELSV